MGMEKYFFSNGDEDHGPHTLSELKYGRLADSISSDTLVWAEGSPSRRRAADLSEFSKGQPDISPDDMAAQKPVEAEIKPSMAPPPIPQEVSRKWHRESIAEKKKEIFLVGYFLAAYKKSFYTRGRASRTECWSFFFCYFLISLSLLLVGMPGLFGIGSMIFGGFIVLSIPANISLQMRRLHDINMSGGWIWLALIPYAGWLALLIMNFMPGTEGTNKFGPEPRAKNQ